MKPLSLYLIIALLATLSVSAAPSCVNDSVANYVALGAGGCSIGDKVFSNFAVTNSGAWVNVTVLNPDPQHMGLQFGGLFASFGGPFVASMSFQVEQVAGLATISDMHLSAGGVGYIPPGVLFSVGEDIMDAGNAVIGSLEVGNLYPPLRLNDSVAFAPVSLIRLNKDISIFNDTNEAFNFSEVTQIVSQTGVPEPATFGFLGVGLVALGAFRRCRR